MVPVCVHPRSIGGRVLEPSQVHASTGSTVKTFLTQDELMSPYDEYEPSLSTIVE